MILDERFDLPADLYAELEAYKHRLEQLSFGERVRHEESQLPRRAQLTGQPFWKRIISYLISLSRLTWTRRQTGVLEDELSNLRQAVTRVVDEEISALARGMGELIAAGQQAQAAHLETLTQVRADLGASLSLARAETAEALRKLADEHTRDLETRNSLLKTQIEALRERIQFERLTRQRAFSDFDRRLALRDHRAPSAPAAEAGTAPPDTNLQSLLESFYFLLEDRYRGTREEIKQRLLVYRNDLLAARERVGRSGPVIDIGCGRGELVELLAEEGFQGLGVDTNPIQLETARRYGCAVVQADAFDYLRQQPTGSVLAVTGVHIVEHIPFPDLVRLMQEIARVLTPGGLAIFETPNPRNLIVGATTFHFDPTHIRPLPAEVLAILLETVGFAHIETRPLHPSDTLEPMVRERNLDRHVASLLFGPQDYAAVATMG